MDDAHKVCVEGDSGLIACAKPWFRPVWESSKDKLTWPNGSIAELYSGEVPGSLRGPQFHAAWVDELAKMRRMQGAWDMLRFAIRLGQNPRTLITTTPTPAKLIRELVADKRQGRDGLPLVRVVRGSTYANAANLADDFLADLRAKYEGTRLGRQELYGEILLDKPGALWTLKRIEEGRAQEAPELKRVVVAIDPPASSKEDSDECGIIAAGVDAIGHGYVLADASERGLSPKQWAEKAIALYHGLGADRIVAEVNQGGEMVETVLRQVDASIAYRGVHATRGKYVRAEPVSALYEQGRVHHVGVFKALEDQLCDFTPDFDRTKAGYSPDRLDSLVWALTELMLASAASAPRIRRLG